MQNITKKNQIIGVCKETYDKKPKDHKWLDDCPPGVDVYEWIENFYLPWAKSLGFYV